jgi:CheY-like chemotaxis protein
VAIAYGIVNKHNRFITVDSALGKGTRFRILLPIVHPVELKEKEMTEQLMSPRGTETIPIAEDDPRIRDLMTTILMEYGYQVISTADGEEAISPFRENKEKVSPVMLDGIMPKKSGKDACSENELPRRKQRGIRCHAGHDPASSLNSWIPAFAGMTTRGKPRGIKPKEIKIYQAGYEGDLHERIFGKYDRL